MHFEEYRETILACRTCLMCRHACTVGNVTQWDTVIPRGKALMLYAMHVGLLEWDERTIELLYLCTNCHLCREWCVSRYDIAPVMLAARADVVRMGLAPKPATLMRDNTLQLGNPYGEAGSPFAEQVQALSLKRSGEVLFYPGCTTAHRRPEIAEAALNLLRHLGTDAAVLPEELCCGAPLYVMGFRSEAVAQAQRATQRIRESGASTIVCPCPTCVKTFRVDYAQWGIELQGIRFVHISEYLAEQLTVGQLQLSQPQPVNLTYHDPCSLGRELGVYEAPRQVLQAIPGVELREMRLSRQFSPCCGNGGGVLATDFHLAYCAGQNAGEVIMETRADILVTACPSCKHSLVKHVRGMEVLDIAELVERCL